MLVVQGADPSSAEKLVEIDAIKSVETVFEKKPMNDRARAILGVTNPLVASTFQGEGQVLAVADTGLDKGDIQDMHPAFQGRVEELIPLGRPDRTDDVSGHGTHVCGSAVGAPASQVAGFQQVQGTAPQAKLVMQSLGLVGGGLLSLQGQQLKDLFVVPYKKYNACVHSNSWGDGVGQPLYPYKDTEAKFVDEAVWENPELLIVMAAGNSGRTSQSNSITGIAACKNVLTVGATESTRPSLGGFPADNKISDNDPTEVAWSSSRGPTVEQRIKPDVVAPGTAILSAKSRGIKFASKMECVDSKDGLYCYTYGTSMATPLVAGCAVVLREFLVKSGTPNPPAALLKALLINGAYAFHHAHNGKEGFGIVNVANSMLPDKDSDACGFRVGPPLTDQGQKNTVTVNVSTTAQLRPQDNAQDPGDQVVNVESLSALRVSPPARKGVTLKATLAYTDMPGAALQNNLNLSVTTADGITRNGNCGSSKLTDRWNNVEQVIWKGIPPGQATITVSCDRWMADQDYALVWRVLPNED
ncbi:peptidase S8/S53 domain-containing protein [Xylariomycetidae sp. FL2044]|nr:peptidase S8/S53 domain-containing protein [Xylariomycetidae sp. FL2044]